MFLSWGLQQRIGISTTKHTLHRNIFYWIVKNFLVSEGCMFATFSESTRWDQEFLFKKHLEFIYQSRFFNKTPGSQSLLLWFTFKCKCKIFKTAIQAVKEKKSIAFKFPRDMEFTSKPTAMFADAYSWFQHLHFYLKKLISKKSFFAITICKHNKM